MNRATTTTRAIFYSQANPSNFKVALFHSTPVLERKRRNTWNFGGGSSRNSSRRHNQHPKRSSKEGFFDFDVFSAHLFRTWHNGFDEQGPSSSQQNSWFRGEHGGKRSRGGFSGQRGANSSGRRAFHFCEDEDDVETIFRSSYYGGNQFFYWSFVDEDTPRWRSSSNYYNKYKHKNRWRQSDEEDYDSSESDGSESNLASERVALGLSSSGPLKMEDVKNAYHACAMKWHPDRHQGSSKAVAEEKFKACNAAYQSLCGKLVPS